MKIAHIAPPWIPVPPKNYGGTEHVIFQLVEEQVAQGHEVTLFAPGDARTSARQISFFAQSLRECNIPWYAHSKAFYHTYKAMEYLKQHLRDFDILHTHLSSASDLYIYPLASTLPLPHISTLHSQFPFDRETGSRCESADTHYMDWISRVPMVAISEHAKREELRKAPLHVIDVIHHGINLKDFPLSKTQPEDFAVWLGRLIPEKGAHLAIEAARKAGMRLILAGIVDEHIPEAEEYFKQEIQPRLDDRQIVFIGPVDCKQRNALLQSARCMLNPLQWEEPFGMVMIEAMANGCPVIAFPRGAAGEIITSERVGLLVNDVTEMVEAIKRIEAIDRRQVRQHIANFFSSEIMVRRYLRVYEKVIATRATAHLAPLTIDLTKKEVSREARY